MNWLESLLWDPSSVAHIVCLYAFVISVGVLLGKIKIFRGYRWGLHSSSLPVS